jgi:predicted nucleic acid-binding protein
MTLVDTSIWIEVFRRKGSLDLPSVINLDEVVTCLPVIQEVLQGFRDEQTFRIARQSMMSFPILDSPLGLVVVEQAAQLYRAARRAGLTIRSGVDCLIAASAVRHDVEVLHRDRDFPSLARVSSLRERRA